jgi:hypothetical protein
MILKIDLDGFQNLQKILINDILEIINVINIIIFFKLIQSHSQRGASSSRLVQVYPDG